MWRSTQQAGPSFRDPRPQAGEKAAGTGRFLYEGVPRRGASSSQEAGPVHHAAAATRPGTDQLPAYLLFHHAVAQAQLAAWLPRGRRTIVDVSGPRGPGAELAARAGHRVLRVIDGSPASLRDAGAEWTDERGASEEGRKRPKGVPEASQKVPPGAVVPLIADPSRLSFLRDGCADAVIAEDRALSTQLAAEAMIAEIARVLRPGGRVLACVDSLMLGMSVLAGQHHWAHLVDLPHAEVVLVPWPDGTITRCYGPDQARELFSGAQPGPRRAGRQVR
jgi:SAM-dependent methyltransferase